MFTYKQLARCKKEYLLSLVEFYGLGEISKYESKEAIIDFILEKLHTDDEDEDKPMSVRVKRMKEQNK